ncbi:hypothetical protein [Streptomyces sp. NPDC023838]|uniref:DUF7683 domain-containing protein n=1 Tax=Streptomyces sp. NPDC023838 TaxID=3154325 RepID=UPI00340A9618
MKYVISLFDKNTEKLLGEIDVSHLSGTFLASLFGIPLSEFVDSYPIGEREAAALSELSGVGFDLQGVDYFLDPYRA